MTTRNQNIQLYAGDHASIFFILTDADNGSKPLDLTATKLVWDVVKEQYRIPMFSKTSEEGDITVKDAQNGKAIVKVSSEDSEKLKRGEGYIHYLRVIDDQGQRSTVSTGNITVE